MKAASRYSVFAACCFSVMFVALQGGAFVVGTSSTNQVATGSATGVKTSQSRANSSNPTPAVSLPASSAQHPLSSMLGGQRTLPKPGQDRVPGEIVIRLKKDSTVATRMKSSLSSKEAGISALSEIPGFDDLLVRHKVKSVESAFRTAKAEAVNPQAKAKAAPADPKRENLFRWYHLQLDTNTPLEAALADFQAHPQVEYAEPCYQWKLADVIDPPITGLPDATTDPDIGQQWHLNAVHAQAAWNYLKQNGVYPGGSHDVVVAVIDTGVDFNHPELIGNIWTNPREIAGNGLDDDGNGFVDDIHGCSVVSDARSHSGDCTDQHGHGTHVAGIIAAQAWNHQGGVGVAFNVQIMAIRAAQYSGVLTTTDISEGILYAVDNGAEVINMSFGGYQRSQMVIDALEVALNQAVLVAAAGNDGLDGGQYPCYPAALPFVHGVMATTADGMLAWFSNTGYDLAAPGETIYSTLPNNQYAAWSGTSMAAPIVSGIAALMRSYYWQREIYSSRFLMGGLWAAGEGTVINAYRALTELPQPGVTMLENWLFDDQGISPRNDADGRVDSGETIHLAIEVINRSGQANHVIGSLRAHAEGAVFDDPYVTLLNSYVSYGNIGPFNTADNGFIYSAGGVITGVQNPFSFYVASNCPNDHVIAFELTFTFEDGWNPKNPGPFTRMSYFNYIVQRGKNIPTVISTNLDLTADEYWMVSGPVLIEPAATLSIHPGTQVQWGAISDDPYNPGPQNGSMIVRGTLRVEGTCSNPVSFFPSYLVAGQVVQIQVDGGQADMSYVSVRNPCLNGIGTVDHGYFDWDYGSSAINAQAISNSVFHKLRGGGSLSAQVFDGCLFDAGWLAPRLPDIYTSVPPKIVNCTFLQDNENNLPLSITAPASIDMRYFGGVRLNLQDPSAAEWRGMYRAVTSNGFTYVSLPGESSALLQQADLIAQYFGGHVTSIADQTEQTFLENYLSEPTGLTWVDPSQPPKAYVIGLTDDGSPGDFHWLDGSPLNFVNWASGFPVALPVLVKHAVVMQSMVPAFYPSPERSVPWLGPWHNMTPIGPFRPQSWGYWDGMAFILKLPGVWTAAQLNAEVANGNVLTFVRPRLKGDVIYNAFLSKYWEPNINRWMRVQAGDGTYSSMNFNYWGTTSTELIDHLIVDYYDNFTSSHVDYAPPPTHGYPSTYPFAEQVLINGASAETVPKLSSGRTEFTFTFNRDMDTNVQPFVTFGPSPPFTDFSVQPRDENFQTISNGWVNLRTWQGSAWITPVTGEGYQLMRVSGAVAADDPWLVSGYDVGRFRFEVRTMTVASMTLQAQGEEGAIRLTWQQNDYELLAGYNLYRADSLNGSYVRLNTTVIPAGSESFLDTNVPPAVAKFYKFSVVTTDMSESDFSNVASASALDTIAPVLTHVPVTSALPGRGLRLTATATDNVRVVSVTLYYRALDGTNGFTALPMVNVSGADWAATIPGSVVQSPGVAYYLTASDGISLAFSGGTALPHVVVVNDEPSLSSVTPNHGPASGGSVVTLAGTQFEPGTSVLFGGVLASNIVVLGANQINCVTPPHFPGLVDVAVVNSNQASSILLNGFRFEADGANLALPISVGDYGSTVEIPITAANVTGLLGADLTVTFNPSVLRATSVRLGALTAGWSLSANLNQSGRVILSLASPTTVSGAGTMVFLSFNVVGTPTSSTPLAFDRALLNDGALVVQTNNGSLTVNGFWSIGGTVRYFQDGAAVSNVFVTAVGTGVFRDVTLETGGYSLTNLPTSSYQVTPVKTNDVRGITAYDASLVLQAAVQLISLNQYQVMAADVNRNGLVTSMDASYILAKSVGLIEGPFPGAGKVWDFLSAQRSYALLNGDLTGQDFTAVLIGDVSGNWSSAGGKAAPSGKSAVGPRGLESVSVIALEDGLRVGLNRDAPRVLLKAVEPIYSLDLELAYEPWGGAVQDVQTVQNGASFALASNMRLPGTVRIAMACAQPLLGEGAILQLNLTNQSMANLRIVSASLNEEATPVLIAEDAGVFDLDGDGLINSDEINLYGTDPLKPDTDGDGAGDRDEVLAGTSPTNRFSVFALRALDLAPGHTNRITWASVPGKRYRVLYKNDLATPQWQPLGAEVMASGAATTQEDALPADVQKRFYRVKLVQ